MLTEVRNPTGRSDDGFMAEKEHGLLHYFATLSTGRTILWCYLIWYLNIFLRYFDPSPQLWLTSLGISGILGIALLLSTAPATGTAFKRDRWQVFRLFLMPLCSSSYAAMVKDKGFFIIFPPDLDANLVPLIVIAAFCIFVTILNLLVSPRKQESTPHNA